MRREGGRYLAVTAVALALAVYLALQILGVVFKLLFLIAAVLIARAAFNAWRAPDER